MIRYQILNINICNSGGNMKYIYIVLWTGIFTILLFSSCNTTPSYHTFTMKDGIANFTFEYSSRFSINESGTSNKISSVSLNGPAVNGIKDSTSILVAAIEPDGESAKETTDKAERNASSFPDYKLITKSEILINGITAYRIDYTERSLLPIERHSNQPVIDVYRELRFDTQNMSWFLQMRSDSSTAEADKVDFEHVINTFKILE
jgi:hypothetical protein